MSKMLAGTIFLENIFLTLTRLPKNLRLKLVKLGNGVAIKIRHGKKTKSHMKQYQAWQDKHEKLLKERDDIREARSTFIDSKLDELSKAVTRQKFAIHLTENSFQNGKPIYSVADTAEVFFATKLLQRNIYRLYKERQANRHELICRIRDTIDSGFPFELVRMDIHSFYESIDRDWIFKKLEDDLLLSALSLKFVKQIFDSYKKLSGQNAGIPRGVGISAYLAELYLRTVDKSIRELPGMVLYCRYVDDIVAVFARPPIGNAFGQYDERIMEILNKRKLSANSAKTESCDFAHRKPQSFHYLGYKFIVSSNASGKSKKLDIVLSQASVDKLVFRLETVFESFSLTKSVDSRKAFKEIVARIKFLTGNTRLKNSKSRTVTGVYYNNPLVTDTKQFVDLDKILKRKIKDNCSVNLRKKLLKYSFEDGFINRRFHNFQTKQIGEIVRVWKNAKA